MRARGWLVACLLLASGIGRAVAAPCPAPATLSVLAENASADPGVTLEIEGELLAPDTTCSGAGATRYATVLTCAGSGISRCGQVEGLRPGAWVHRVRVQVSGSEEQVQRQRAVLLAAGTGVSNIVSWIVYPRTLVVRETTGAELGARLDEAAAFTATSASARALVIFDGAVFRDADRPGLIRLKFTPRNATSDVCADDATCADGRPTSYCFSGSRVVVDALDAAGRPGAAIVSVGKCARSVFRITGSDNVLRGLELRGSEKLAPTIAVDTVALGGAGAQRNRIEQCIVRGPNKGDAVSVEGGAGTPGGPDHDNVVLATEITGAADKGLKVTTNGHVTVADSCIHDNLEGGIQSTGGGDVTALRNVIQRNRLGQAQNGILVGVPNEVGPPNLVQTDGNVVRFSGARGVSVVNAASAVLRHDVLSENQQAGLRIETTLAGAGLAVTPPVAQLRGVALSCNYKRVTGECEMDAALTCAADRDCPSGDCVHRVDHEPEGIGAVVDASCPGCAVPVLDLGTGGRDAGRNALTQNRNPLEFGVNLRNRKADVRPIQALGNQWERCGPEATCNVAAVQARDLQPPTAAAADIGTPTGPRGGPPPTITRIVPARPRAGDFVRVYNGSLDSLGGTFNAIDGAACTAAGVTPDGQPAGLPSDPCSPESPEVAAQNRTVSNGNTVTISIGGEVLGAEVHAVTPTMLLFRMPVDCFAPATLVVTRGNDAPSPPVTLCDPGGCADRPAGALCDDGNTCTLDERCDGSGACAAGAMLDCSGSCLGGLCDPDTGCIPAADDPTCDDGNSCTSDRCIARATCQSIPAADGVPCPPPDRCHLPGTCRAGACDGGQALVCDDGDFCTDDACEPAAGCQYVAVTGVRRGSCRVAELRAMLAALPDGGGKVGRALSRRLARADKALARAADAQKPRRARKATRKALAQLREFVGHVRRARRTLGAAVERQLTRSAKTAIANLAKPDA